MDKRYYNTQHEATTGINWTFDPPLFNGMLRARSLASSKSINMRIFVVRHGQTDMNINRLPQRGQDPPINATGADEARRCSRYLTQLLKGKEFDAVFYSPLKRTTQTMELLMADRPTPRVCETAEGLKQGCLVSDVQEFISYSFDKIQTLGLQNVLIVSHGPVIKYMFQWLSDIGRLQHQQSRFDTPRNTAVAEIYNSQPREYVLRRYDSLP